MSQLIETCKKLKKATQVLVIADTREKNKALAQVALSLQKNTEFILQENKKDIENARATGMKESLIDRLSLDKKRIEDMIEGINTIIDLKDPVWKSNDVWTLENGLTISKMTVPIGVIGIIYESRPNVTIDAFALTLKSGNCILLRGSSTAIHSNRALVMAVKEGLRNSSITEDVIGFIDDVDRAVVKEMLILNQYIDLIIPRGGDELIQFVVKHATVPTIETGVGNCHVFVDESGDIGKALNIIENAKTQRAGVCNACETILIHKNIANEILPKLNNRIADRVELRGCEKSRSIVNMNEATEEDWSIEYLDFIVAVRIVDSIDEAIEHVNKYGTKHSEAIVTENLNNANRFLREVDAAAVYVNASTRFTDGSQFGFGAEMGISTQKMHARGPMGLNELVTVKYTIMGNGQIRE
ncbi:glutamate-5-semialdehyde dehydrogenase [Serpentinicella alkaliphila]|uniref:Gamma-glutamyl phosphate reductase n=1 Tax=Serpentinicella alkaliphila TaxID=1734049 RepID=A0A4V2T454_9FIRM|nr:glutamate-5-semialdehyde dehydrogenase [Serpentinicella alkaliphila]QUH24714.1 glutamate-5-semialdehyde dehydrogenase [Serpentinicella alkaliphila]TCQ03704.1 glutamate-5-semialdehyde dehydrogenase [Serpentinicella alkaliphila]